MRRLGPALCALLMFAACSRTAPVTSPSVLPPATDAAAEPERLVAGDQIELIFTRTNASQAGSYRLQVGDLISIDVADQPDISAQNLRVLPDGRVSMRVVGVVTVTGRTVEQVSGLIASSLERKGIRAPDVVVSVQNGNQKLEQFMRSVAPEGMGGRVQVRLGQGERLSLPLIPPIPVNGRTLADVRGDVVNAYRDQFGDQVDVAVNVREQAEALVYVGGEVQKPGILPLKPGANAATVVAGAGGMTEIADKSQVVVVRFRPDGGFYHWIVDFNSFDTAVRSPGFQTPLRPRDVIYVARAPVGDINRFVDLYLRKNIPIPLGFGFSP